MWNFTTEEKDGSNCSSSFWNVIEEWDTGETSTYIDDLKVSGW